MSKFITIEGIEGAGKTTAVRFIMQYLLKAGKKVTVTREPGGSIIAEEIREILLNPDQNEMIYPQTELLLMFASRAQHLACFILPQLAAGNWVLCDRFVDASYAYQGAGRGIDKQSIQHLEKLVVGDLKPDLTFLLDIEPSLGLARSKKRGPQDRFEKEAVSFFDKVRKCYLERAQKDPRFVVVNAAQPVADVQAQLKDVLETLI